MGDLLPDDVPAKEGRPFQGELEEEEEGKEEDGDEFAKETDVRVFVVRGDEDADAEEATHDSEGAGPAEKGIEHARGEGSEEVHEPIGIGIPIQKGVLERYPEARGKQ